MSRTVAPAAGPGSPESAASKPSRPGPSHTLARYAVPLLFAALCLGGILVARITPSFLLSEMLVRVGRNSILVLSLLIPILAGLGLNFGIVIGAMAGQIAAILVVYWGLRGIGGFGLALAIATPICGYA